MTLSLVQKTVVKYFSFPIVLESLQITLKYVSTLDSLYTQ